MGAGHERLDGILNAVPEYVSLSMTATSSSSAKSFARPRACAACEDNAFHFYHSDIIFCKDDFEIFK